MASATAPELSSDVPAGVSAAQKESVLADVNPNALPEQLPETAEVFNKDPTPNVTTTAPPEPVAEAAPSSTEPEASVPAAVQTGAVPVPQPETKLPETEPAVANGTIETAPLKDGKPTWPILDDAHPISRFRQLLPDILTTAGYNEVYGLKLSPDIDGAFHTNLILQKFLRANANDLEKAKTQLEKTLAWRKEFKPLECVDAVFSQDKFDKLGYVAKLNNGKQAQVVTFNLYGTVQDKKKTFGDVESFLKWRVALMELTLRYLHLDKATEPIADYTTGKDDPYRAIQVHDYNTLSFLRQDPYVKAATKRTIDIMVNYYPETLSRKFFVNISSAAVLIYKAMTYVLPKATTNKFVLCASGRELTTHLPEFKAELPDSYGGENLGTIDIIGKQLRMDDSKTVAEKAEAERVAAAEQPVSAEAKAEPKAEATTEVPPTIPEPISSSATTGPESSALPPVESLSLTDNGAPASSSAQQAVEAEKPAVVV